MKGKKKLTKVLIIIISIFVIFFLVRFIICQVTLRNSTNRNEISELQQVKLDNKMQTVLLEGETKNLPIMITVHGGPGSPIPFNVGCRGIFPELTNKYIMVYWDQYGCAKNYEKLNHDVTIDSYANMLSDLVLEMKKQFPNKKIYLFGMSWGTVLTCKVANRLPNDINGVVAYGQIIRDVAKDKDTYNQLVQCDLTVDERKVLKHVMESDNCDMKSRLEVYALISKYTNGFFYKDKDESNSRFYKIILKTFFSPDYSLKNAYGTIVDGNQNVQTNSNVLEEMFNINLTKELLQLKVPYLILQGKDDIVASTSIAKQVVENSNNPNLKIKVFENSGHIPTNNCFEKVISSIIDFKSK
ncbi:alpha/beta fold hydrolase [Clostridium lacusfryxellense]|uniref:alpha/beta fold hydrolase n=1 Tax=Clostridium lacusfryxellense TaxID=205328 RepID=UPI001C0D9BAD|nr:alpha/beta hydrolase [Clostridium lacusfryxellense]MBU3113200.1 alpha/beta hydrolase [Clostridium lacusfryxellense]